MAAARPAPRILGYGDGRLRRMARPAVSDHVATAELLDDLWRALAADGGIGLAAPQIGVLRRVFVVRDPRARGPGGRLELINPRILATGGDREPFEEGCLSFPGLYMTVLRPTRVEVAYEDRAGGEHRQWYDGLPARVIQHEFDHLDGVLFIDRLPRWRRWLLWPRLAWIAVKSRWRDQATEGAA